MHYRSSALAQNQRKTRQPHACMSDSEHFPGGEEGANMEISHESDAALGVI